MKLHIILILIFSSFLSGNEIYIKNIDNTLKIDANNIIDKILFGDGVTEGQIKKTVFNALACDDGDPKTINDRLVIDSVCMGYCGGKLANQWFSLPMTKEELNLSIITYAGDLNKICTSNITDMSYLFLNNITFNEDISSWDVSNVINMSGMFSGANSFNQNISSWKPNIVGKPADFDIGTPVGFINNSAVQPVWK